MKKYQKQKKWATKFEFQNKHDSLPRWFLPQFERLLLSSQGAQLHLPYILELICGSV